MCKHIHLLCRALDTGNNCESSTFHVHLSEENATQISGNATETAELIIDENDISNEKNVILNEVSSGTCNNPGDINKLKSQAFEEVHDILNNLKTVEEINLFRQSIKSIVPLLDATRQGQRIPLPVQSQCHENKNIVHQRRFVIKKKKKARKQLPTSVDALKIALSTILEPMPSGSEESV